MNLIKTAVVFTMTGLIALSSAYATSNTDQEKDKIQPNEKVSVQKADKNKKVTTEKTTKTDKAQKAKAEQSKKDNSAKTSNVAKDNNSAIKTETPGWCIKNGKKIEMNDVRKCKGRILLADKDKKNANAAVDPKAENKQEVKAKDQKAKNKQDVKAKKNHFKNQKDKE